VPVVAGGLLAGCEPQKKQAAVAKQETVTLKMQAAWPSGANIFFEMAGDYCKMVDEMSGGTLKIDLQPVGAVVKTSEIGTSSKYRRSRYGSLGDRILVW
jgi:TRAP-type mannitol/chloroaromatic compound transport system substrate-binding protein